jgi:hypothetical protein
MKRLVQLLINLLANVLVVAICPFLVLAWVVRVYLHERAWHRGSPQPKRSETRAQLLADSNL